MKLLLYIFIMVVVSTTCAAQSDKIDLSKPPGQAPLLNNKSNATLLRESSKPANQNPADTNLAEKYKADPAANGTFRSLGPTTSDQPQMMNATQQQGNIGNLKTNSATYYDNSGKIRGTSTTIDFGKKKK